VVFSGYSVFEDEKNEVKSNQKWSVACHDMAEILLMS
jgi:hypothetical protein